MVIAGKWASGKELLADLHGMAFDVDIPLSSFKVNDYKLVVLIKHEMLGLNISVEKSTVMNKFKNFEDINKNILIWKTQNIRFIFFHDDDVHVIGLEVVKSVNTGPF